LGVYTLCLGGEIAYTKDSNQVVAVTQTFLSTGSYATRLQGDPPYSIYGLGMSLWYTPVRWAVNRLLPDGLTLTVREYWRRQGYMFLNTLASAGIGLVLSMWAFRWGLPPSSVLLGVLCYGLATLQMPYARYDFTEPVTGFLLLGGTYSLWRYLETNGWRELFFSGIFLGAGALTRIPVGVVALLFAGFVLVWTARNHRLLHVAAYVFPLLAALAVIMIYNYSRFGNVFTTGYPVHFDTPLWKGLAGLLVSPGEGSVFYTPVSLVGITVLFLSRKPDRGVKGLTASAILLFLILNAKWRYWFGGWSWGPRLLLPVLPYAGLGLCILFAETRFRLIWSLLLFGVGGLINFLAIYIPFSDYLHTLSVHHIPESTALWNPKYSVLKIQHEYLSQVYWRNYDFMWLRGKDWGWMVWVVALFGLGSATLGAWLVRTQWDATLRDGLAPSDPSPPLSRVEKGVGG